MRYQRDPDAKLMNRKITSPYRRQYVYNSTFLEIMTWGKEAVSSGLIPRTPSSNKPNFPYYLEQYLKHLQSRSHTKN